MKTFDATVDFDQIGALETELQNALGALHAPKMQTFAVVIRAEGEGCERGEIYFSDEIIPGVKDNDWCVTAVTVLHAAELLRQCLRAA